MTLKYRPRNLLALEQQAAELAAQQAELQQALRQRKLGPIDYQIVQAELVAARGELHQVWESLAATKQQQERRRINQDRLAR